MSDYIKREDVLTLFDFTTEATESEAEADAAMFLTELIKPLINNLPAADVVERKIGEWGCERVDFSVIVAPGAYVIRSPTCSVCGYHAIDATNYCPNCGAEMRKGGET